MNCQGFPDWSGLQHMIWWNPDSFARSIWCLKTKVSRAKVQSYHWLIVWVNVLACKLDSLTETIWGYCDKRGVQACTNIGGVFMDHTLGMTWITMPEVDHKGCKVTAIRAESYAGDKGSWEVGIGGVGCRAVDGWTREMGASRCLKPLTATKTADPRTGTDSEELRGGLHWSQKSSLQQVRPIESFMGPGNRKCKRDIFFHIQYYKKT